jgi:hypothetical protein
MKRSLMVEGYGIPLGRVLAPANRHDSPLLAPTLDKLGDLGPLPEDITVHLGAGYDAQKTRDELAGRGMTGKIAHKGDQAPIQAGQRWHVERTNAGTTPSTGCSAATNATRMLSKPISTWPTPSSPSVALSARHGPSTDGTPARRSDHDHLPIRVSSKLPCMRRILLGGVAGVLLLAVGTRAADALGIGGPRLRCGCTETCWCKRPDLTIFRWVTPGRWHHIGLSAEEKQSRHPQT